MIWSPRDLSLDISGDPYGDKITIHTSVVVRAFSSLQTHRVPTQWKKAILIPVPKKPCPRENNDFRAVTLTSAVIKTFERIMLGELRAQEQHLLDPFQVAYRSGISTADALSTASHLILKHLENTKAFARLLFMGFCVCL